MSDEQEKTADKKLFIDEDWKSRVEAEKEAARHTGESPAETGQASAPRGPMPPASLSYLVGTLHLQTAIALGLLPNPVTKKTEVQLEQAKHSIDLLTVLQQKTEGNRTPEESEEIESVLNELRWAYISMGNPNAT